VSAYTDAVAHNLEGLHVSPGACPGCAECGLDTVPCPNCKGSGTADGLTLAQGSTYDDCSDCDGLGRVDGEPDSDTSDGIDAIQLAEEPSFGSHDCDGCGSNLAGDRHPAHAITKRYRFQEAYYGLAPSGDEYILHLSVCTDCLMYLANGDEPEGWPYR